MQLEFQVPALPDGIQVAYGFAGIVVAAIVAANLSKRPNVRPNHRLPHPKNLTLSNQLDAIPTVGSSTWLGSWWVAIKGLAKAADVIQEGYEKVRWPVNVFAEYELTIFAAQGDTIQGSRSVPVDGRCEWSPVLGRHEQGFRRRAIFHGGGK
jgi:hypothetical protein